MTFTPMDVIFGLVVVVVFVSGVKVSFGDINIGSNNRKDGE